MSNTSKNVNRKYSVSEYDPNWVNQFFLIKTFLSTVFGDKIKTIEHVGSTSIPGVKAKPLIDVLVVVKQMQDFEKEKAAMIKAGYEWGGKITLHPTHCFFIN